MKKNAPTMSPVTKDDVRKCVDRGDFALELRAAAILRSADMIVVQHGGVYADPFTGTPRQFDIRASWLGGRAWLALAVECKNLKPYNPLVVSCTPRLPSESQCNYLLSSYIRQLAPSALSTPVSSRLYPCAGPAGRATDQVSHTAGGTNYKDGDTFSKWNQALASAADLVSEGAQVGLNLQNECIIGLIVPILVVPKETLWQCVFNEQFQSGEPELVDRCSLYLNQSYDFRDHLSSRKHHIGHLEIVTIDRLRTFIQELRESFNDASAAGVQFVHARRYTAS